VTGASVGDWQAVKREKQTTARHFMTMDLTKMNVENYANRFEE
jgi:hypothetical protein